MTEDQIIQTSEKIAERFRYWPNASAKLCIQR